MARAETAGLASLDDIDGSFVARVHPDALDVAVGEDRVVVRVHAFVLNRTASLVWQCLDGSGTLDEIVADLSDVTGTDDATIRHDVLELARALGERGLLDGVAPPPPAGDVVVWEPPTPTDVGEELEDFVLRDVDGHEVGLSYLRGGDVLLINWSPSCGFCLKIGAELAGLEAPLRERGVTPVFVANGSSDANREAMRAAGIGARVLLKADGIDPFGAFGTPAAYHLDAKGRVAAPMAYGADVVPVLARELAGVAAVEDTEGGANYLPAASAVCGPGGGTTQSPGTEWAGTRAVKVEGYHVGVRYNSAGTLDLLDRLFPGLTLDDPKAPANYAVALYPPEGRSRDLNLLVKGASQLARSRSRARVLRALVGHLSADLYPREPGCVHVNATGAVRHGAEGVLLPGGLVAWVKQLQPRLARRGIQLVDLPWASVDPVAGALVVPAPQVAHDQQVLDDLVGDRLGSELPPVGPGSYPLRAWFALFPPEEHVAANALSPASLVAAVAGALIASGDEYAAALGHLATVAATVPGYRTTAASPESLVHEIEAVLG